LLTASPIVTSTNYRAIAARIRARCSDCTVIVGNGYAGAVPACVLYETKQMKMVVMNAGDTGDDVLARSGSAEPLLFVKTNEPPTVAAEDQFVLSHFAIWKDGYFEIYPDGVMKTESETASDETMVGRNSGSELARSPLSRR